MSLIVAARLTTFPAAESAADSLFSAGFVEEDDRARIGTLAAEPLGGLRSDAAAAAGARGGAGAKVCGAPGLNFTAPNERSARHDAARCVLSLYFRAFSLFGLEVRVARAAHNSDNSDDGTARGSHPCLHRRVSARREPRLLLHRPGRLRDRLRRRA